MIYRFAGFELDEEQRELRLGSREIPLQPRIFDLISYLIRHRERVVSKDELLDALWSDVIVADGALQRAVSLARSALQQGGAQDVLRTYARHGYRFCAEASAIEAGERPLAADEAPLTRARAAYQQGDWEIAISSYQEADREAGLVGADLERWADAARCVGQDREAIGPLERAAAAYAAGGDRIGAARAALMLAQLRFEWREMSVATGWHSRASSLLQGRDDCREHGLLEWLASRFAAANGELDQAVSHARNALDCGRRLEDPDLEALGLLYWGLALLAQGDVRGGLARQDEAAASVLSGQVTPWVGGTVYCGIIWGCRNRRDWQRAAEWTDQFSRWCDRSRLAGFPGLCRLHRAEVLSVRGDLAGAEQEVTEAAELLSEAAPWAEGDAYRVLGEIFLARGDLDDAEAAFRRAYSLGWDPQPGQALLHLARGRHDAAVRALERSLEDPRWVNGQRRGILLAHLAVASAVAGDRDRTRAALRELEERPDLCDTPAFAATIARARAEAALWEHAGPDALSSLRESLAHWRLARAPLDAANTQLRIVEVLAANGDPDGAEMELHAAESAFRSVGAQSAISRCAELRRQLSQPPR